MSSMIGLPPLCLISTLSAISLNTLGITSSAHSVGFAGNFAPHNYMTISSDDGLSNLLLLISSTNLIV